MLEKKLTDCRDFIEEKIDELFPKNDLAYSIVSDAARYSLKLGGKRIRPFITLQFCKLFGGDTQSAVNFAVALEMVHTYSLIHDDLPCMDNDDLRRGKPSCHKAFSEDIALLAGDTLLTESFGVITKANISSENIVKAVQVLSYYAGLHGMIGGQVLDLEFEKTQPSADMLIDMYSRKTAGLLISAAKLGLIAAGKTDQETLSIAEEYALNLGIAFQVIDDILDFTADEKLLGKPVGSDEKNNKTTFVTLFGLEKAKEIAKDFTEKALLSLKKIEGDTKTLEELTEYLLCRDY